MIKLVRPKFWEKKNFISQMLLVFSSIYLVIFYLKKYFTFKYNSRIKTICIGNVTLGGGGKTPSAIAIYKILQSQGMKVCIVTRGYGGLLKGPVKVDIKLHDVSQVGDEPLLMAQESSDVFVAKNRLDGLKFVEKLQYDYAIFDDGLQDFRINYTKSILCYHSKTLGNKNIFPAGPLREILSFCIKRVDYILCEESDASHYFKDKIIKYNINTSYIAERDKKYLLFCGIAYPEKFFQFAQQNGVTNYITKIFPDHHMYTISELNQIISYKQDCILLTTSKDYVKIPIELQGYFEVMDIQYKFQDQSFLKI
jgi:tetraacyldisaccharide 4'-kinase